MFPECWDAALVAQRAVAEASGGDAEAEVLLRVSSGIAVRRARGAPDESSEWSEESVAVRVLLPGGGEGLCTAASWIHAAEAARRAVALARLNDDPAELREPKLVAPRGLAPSRADSVPRHPQDEGELKASIAEIEAAALGVDERVVALDAALARSAVVDSYLAGSSGLALHQRHASAAAHATIIARDGMNVAVRGDAWAGPRLTIAEARLIGRRLGRAGLVHLVGSGAAPPQPKAAMLSATALAEIAAPFTAALLGLATDAPPAADGFPPELRLEEDSVRDESARALPVDGEGRLLREVAVLRDGRFTPPGPAGLPRVRPGSGDAARPGHLRLSFSWRGGEDEAALLARLGTGLWIESAHGISSDPLSLAWRGVVAGFWVEDGRRRQAVAGVPFAANLFELLRGAVAGGAEPEIAHATGGLRAIPLVVRLGTPD